MLFMNIKDYFRRTAIRSEKLACKFLAFLHLAADLACIISFFLTLEIHLGKEENEMCCNQ